MTNEEIITEAQKIFPKFTKAQLSMIRHSDRYGVVASPKLQRIIDGDKRVRKKQPETRKKIGVRIDNDEYARLKEKLGETAVQDFLYELIKKEIE